MTAPLAPLVGVATDLASPLLRFLGRAPSRRVGTGGARTHVELHGMHHDGSAEARRLLEKQLVDRPGVHAAAVNAVLGRVVVDHDPAVPLADLLAVVAEVEQENGLADAGTAPASAHHPADTAAPTRQLVALGVDVVGLGAVVAERVLVTLPVTSGLVPPVATAALSLADAVPSLRALAERTAGASATESWFSIGSAAAQALGRGPLGLVADACYRSLRAREALARRRAWQELDAALPVDGHRAEPCEALGTPRPVALRTGAVQRVGDAAGVAAIGALGLAAALAPSRATAVTLAGVPKAARWGWEAFAAAAGHALAERAVLVVDPSVLRRADRVDTVVVDPALPPVVARAARRIGSVVVTDTTSRAVVSDLQRDGGGVAVVSADPGAADALALADVAVFVGGRLGTYTGTGTDEPGALVWTADLLCPDADAAVAVLGVLAAGPSGARRAAGLAVLASCVALPTAVLLAPLPGLNGWASLPVTSGALVALGVGTLTGAGAVPGPNGRS